MKAKELTPLQRIMILEDVLRKLESGDRFGGLCFKIEDSADKLFELYEFESKNIIPLFTLKNAKKVTEVKAYAASEKDFWWDYYENYDFENRIKFVKWMIEQEKEFLK